MNENQTTVGEFITLKEIYVHTANGKRYVLKKLPPLFHVLRSKAGYQTPNAFGLGMALIGLISKTQTIQDWIIDYNNKQKAKALY